MQELTIYLEDGRRIRELAAQVAALEEERDRLRERVRDLEFKYRCETIVSLELTDLCREHGLKVRPGLKSRPWGEGSPSSP